MGCCFSVSRDPTAEEHLHNDNSSPTTPRTRPVPPHRTSSPSQSQTNTSSRQRHQTTSSSSTNNGRNQTHRSRSRHQQTITPAIPLTQPINTPIIPHTWSSKKRLWTRSLLDRERKEFFETRVTGRAEVWAALNAALSFMRQGDFETAQSIVDAAGVTVPTGDLCQGVYDERGVLYRLPRCIVSDPVNIVVGALGDENDLSTDGDGDGDEIRDEDGEEVDVGFETDDRKGGFGFEDEVESGDELIGDGGGGDADERERRRDEKGKTSERDLIRVKARLSDRDGADVVVSVRKTQNVGFLARKVQQEVGTPRTQRIRIAYLGKILKDHTSLVDQGWKPGDVVNALVVARRPSISS